MKELYKIFEKDIMSEKFTKRELFIYGVIAPIVLTLICWL